MPYSNLNPTNMMTHSGIAATNRGVLAAAATGLDGFIRQMGGNTDTILGRSGVDPEWLMQPTSSLTLVSYCEVLEQAAQATGCDHFGLYYGKQFMPQQLGLLGYIGLCSPTVGEAIQNVARCFHWHQHDTFTQWVEQKEAWRFDYQIRHGAIMARRQDAELTMGMIVNLVRQAAGLHWAPKEVHFEHPAPSDWHEHCKVFDAPVYFNQPFNSLVIAKSVLQRPMPSHDPLLLPLMFAALSQINSTPTRQSMTEQVSAHIQHQLAQGEPQLEAIALQMGITRMSLQRQLRQEQQSFRQLVEQVRCAMAKQYLQQDQLAITDLGMMLGYSETSAFSRAFRRWFGVSPSRYRRQS
ncbi:AraC-like transcriptional regulator QhpR [Vibrio porteresiae]|uniref:AraC family transcriptional regulator n=1 Tax=Vibrio porteresiae DSM 19223 TaxID=1123496 RepID=A0ABZ0QGY5_9VIBR|nr:AraC family transcriptional regulator [Vibrio porteresiae]WPC75762.1 AraC family transcriptional regulator [Vibrio porteresiae DSM 19223]